MKKILALILSLVMAFSFGIMGFAGEDKETEKPGATNNCPNCERQFSYENEYNEHLKLCNVKTCTKCEEEFANEDAYNNHIEICTEGDETDYVDLTIKEILEMLVDLIKTFMEQWEAIEDVVIRVVDFVEPLASAEA